MIAYSRKIRPLIEISQFKANELFNWLFYLSPILFLNCLTSDLLSHLNNLVFGLRLIFESNYVSNVKMAEKLLNNFCQDIVSIHDGNERIETINVHCLRHLADQVARFGPLYCYSAMSFEAANRTLSDVYSGSHSECEVICRRVLQRHKLADTEIRDPNLRSIFFKLSGISDTTNENFSEDFLETEALRKAQMRYPKATLYNRQVFNNVYFDSISFKRSKHGNCYVAFKKGGCQYFGQIQFFFELKESTSDNKILAYLKLLTVKEEIGPIKGYFYRVSWTPNEEALCH